MTPLSHLVFGAALAVLIAVALVLLFPGSKENSRPQLAHVLDVLVYSWQLERVKLNLDDADRKLNHINQLCVARSDFSLTCR